MWKQIHTSQTVFYGVLAILVNFVAYSFGRMYIQGHSINSSMTKGTLTHRFDFSSLTLQTSWEHLLGNKITILVLHALHAHYLARFSHTTISMHYQSMLPLGQIWNLWSYNFFHLACFVVNKILETFSNWLKSDAKRWHFLFQFWLPLQFWLQMQNGYNAFICRFLKFVRRSWSPF